MKRHMLTPEEFPLPYVFDHVLASAAGEGYNSKRLIARVTLEPNGLDTVHYVIFANGQDAGAATHLKDAVTIYNEN